MLTLHRVSTSRSLPVIGRRITGERAGCQGGEGMSRGHGELGAGPGSVWDEGQRGMGDIVCVTSEPAPTSTASVPGVNSEENQDFLGKLHGKKNVIPAYGSFARDCLRQK